MTIKILMLLGKVGEHCFLSAGSLMKRVGAMINHITVNVNNNVLSSPRFRHLLLNSDIA